MFNLALIDDTIKIEAAQLALDTVAALTNNINAKYSDRILPNVGLCVCHFDYSSISEGHLRNGDGCTYYKVTFRLIVFRPFKGEIIIGRVISCNDEGVRLSLGFFNEVYISRDALPSPSAFDHKEREWFYIPWSEQAGVDDDPLLSIMKERFYLSVAEPVRFRVEGDEFNEPEPPGPNTWGKKASLMAANAQGVTENAESPNAIPVYKVHASIAADGLGSLSWWETYEQRLEEQ